jgi:hypothetical protein
LPQRKWGEHADQSAKLAGDADGYRRARPSEFWLPPILVGGAVSKSGDFVFEFQLLELEPSDFDITGTGPAQDFLDPALEKLVLLRKLCEMCV